MLYLYVAINAQIDFGKNWFTSAQILKFRSETEILILIITVTLKNFKVSGTCPDL